MADNYLTQNQNLYGSTQQSLGDLQVTTAEGKNPSSDNQLQTTNSQIFAQYYQDRHNPDGHMNTGDDDGLTFIQKNQMSYYQDRKIRERNMMNDGVSEANIALFRSWDDDIKSSEAEGKAMDMNTMLSPDYSASAIAKYNFDEAMYSKYVANSKQFSAEEYDPDGDGILNYTEDVIKSFDGMTNEDLANSFDWMDSEQKRMLAFDGISTRSEYAKYAKGLYDEYHASHSGFWYNAGQFFKGIAHGFISAVMDVVKIPTTLISLVGAGVTWAANGFKGNGFDNPLSKTMGDWNKAIDDNTTGAYDKAVSLDSDNTWAKIGGFAGQAIEIAGEVLLTGGIATAARMGGELGIKSGEKLIEKGTEKAIEKGTGKIIKYGGKEIERKAIELAKNKGIKMVTETEIEEATNHLLGDMIEDESNVAVEKAVASATTRLAKRGVYEHSAEALEKVTSDIASKGIAKVTEGIAEKQAAKEAAKETSKLTAKGTAKKIVSTIRRKGKSQRSINKILKKGTQEHMIAAVAERPGVVKRALSRTFKANDPLTKLFSVKSFASSVQNSQANGDNFAEAFARATLAYGTTNLIWGSSVLGKEGNAISRMINKHVGKDVKLFNSKLLSSMVGQSGEVITVAGKMWADGTIHDFINQGVRKGDDGKLHIGLVDAIKSNLTMEKIGEDFMSAFTMHMTGSISRGTKSIVKNTIGKTFMRKSAMTDVLGHVDSRMGSDTGIGTEIWEKYKTRAKQNLGEKATDLDILDNAATLARAEGGYVSKLVDQFFVEGSAYSYGIDFRSNLEDVSEYVDTKTKEMNDHIDAIVKEHGSVDRNVLDNNFKLFQQHAMMNNTNGFNGEELPSDIKVPNWQPEDFVVAYSRYKSKGLGTIDGTMQEDIVNSFKEADEIKKVLGNDAYKSLTTMTFDEISRVSDRLYNPIDKENAKNWVTFHDEITKELNSKEPSQEKINALVDKHKMTEKKLNQEIGKGMSEAINDKEVVVTAMEKNANEIKGALSDGTIESYMKEKSKAFINVEDLFENIEEAAKNKRLTAKEKTQAIIAAYDALYSSLEAEQKNLPLFKRYKEMSDANKLNKNKKILIGKLKRFESIASSVEPADKTSSVLLREGKEAKALTAEADKLMSDMSKVSTTESFDDVWKEVTGDKYTLDNIQHLRDLAKEYIPLSRTESKVNTQTMLEDKVAQIAEALKKKNNGSDEMKDMQTQLSEMKKEIQTIKDNSSPDSPVVLEDLPIYKSFEQLTKTLAAVIDQQSVVLEKPIGTIEQELEEAPPAPTTKEPEVVIEPITEETTIEEPEVEQEEPEVVSEETKEYKGKNTAARIEAQRVAKIAKENNKLLEEILDTLGEDCAM